MTDNAKKSYPQMPKQPQIYIFGCSYSKETQQQAYFSHKQPKRSIELQEMKQQLQEENSKLKYQLNEVRKILAAILYTDLPPSQSTLEMSIIQLLEGLLAMILSKAEENSFLKQKLEEISFKTVQDIQSRISLSQSKQIQSKQSSQMHIYTPIQSNNLSRTSECYDQIQVQKTSRQNAIKKSRYEPKILFSIGKEVKTVNQFSSNTILKKDSSNNSYSKSSSQQNSYKELMRLTKKSRLSIDKSIYILDEKQVDNIRFSVQNLNKSSNSYESGTKKNLCNLSNELTPIKEERFSDKYSELHSSKIKFGGSNIQQGERFTFQSTNTDPQSYTTNKHY